MVENGDINFQLAIFAYAYGILKNLYGKPYEKGGKTERENSPSN